MKKNVKKNTLSEQCTSSTGIALLVHARQRSADFITKIKTAMKIIEDDIEHNEGIYPFNSGRLSIAELCRRAEVACAVLQNPTHKNTTRRLVEVWLTRVTSAYVAGNRSIRKTVTVRVDDWKLRHAAIVTQYTIAKLELLEAERKIEDLNLENKILQKELAELDGKKTTLPPKRLR